MGTKKEKPIEQLTAAECAERIKDLRARAGEIAEREKEIRPPASVLNARSGAPPPGPKGTPGYGTGGRDFDALAGAGPEYRRVALEGSAQEMAAIEEESRLLDAEGTQLGLRIHALERREKQAREQEATAAAPGRLKALTGQLDGMLDRAEAAIGETRSALGELGAWLRDVHAQRDLVGEDVAVVAPAQFRRLGLVLRHRLLEIQVHELESVGRPTQRVPALFNTWGDAIRNVRLLGPPAERLLSKLSKMFVQRGAPDHHRQHEERQLRAAIDRERVLLIAAGALDRVEDAEELARGTLRAQYADGRSADAAIDRYERVR